MAVNARWRKNPFTGTTNSIAIAAEPHTIEYHTEMNAYGFFANEGVVLDTGDPVVLTQDNSALTAFAEVPKITAPNAGQFRVDYDATGYFNTGFVNCNASDAGKAVLFTYRGTGTILHPTFRLQTDFNLPGNLNVEGDVSLASASGSEITANGKRIQNVADPAADMDAMNRRSVLQELPFRNYEELTASGTWTKPANVDKVFVECVGGGGGGGASTTASNPPASGGNGGEVVRGLISVSGNVSYTIGAGGSAGASSEVGGDGGAGGDGGTTTFSSISAAGGKGGNGAISSSNNATPPAAQTHNGGLAGGGGSFGVYGNRGGNGGGGGAGRGAFNGSPANDAQAGIANTGGGGGGAAGSSLSLRQGAAGGSGVIRLWY